VFLFIQQGGVEVRSVCVAEAILCSANKGTHKTEHC